MAGDWIKMRNDLSDDPAVIAIAGKTGLDEFAVVGRLHALWSWADQQSRDGHAPGVTSAWLDRKVQRDGFASALVSVGWLEVADGGLRLPNFDHHNGKTAKVRALGTRRKQAQRHTGAPISVSSSVAPMSANGHANGHAVGVTKARPEKRREEIEENPPNPQRGSLSRFPPGFEDFWSAYPKKVGKDAAVRAYGRRKFSTVERQAVLDAITRQKGWETWTRESGQFIPHPSTWLNEGRWMDERPTVSGAPVDRFAAGAH